jgi:hypothetical protein
MAPTRTAVRTWLRQLATGELSREDAANLARPWVNERERDVTDEALWMPLSRLASADLETDPSEYLYGLWDFEEWLAEFELSVEFDERSP